MIDLRDYLDVLIDFTCSALASFRAAHPGEVLSCCVLWCDPGTGTLELSLDTPGRSADIVVRFPQLVRADEAGPFNDNPADFAHHAWDVWFPEDWQTESEKEDEPSVLRGVDGREVWPGKDIDEFNEPFYQLLRLALADKRVGDEVCALSRHEPFRLGIVMPESRWVEFWRFPEVG